MRVNPPIRFDLEHERDKKKEKYPADDVKCKSVLRRGRRDVYSSAVGGRTGMDYTMGSRGTAMGRQEVCAI